MRNLYCFRVSACILLCILTSCSSAVFWGESEPGDELARLAQGTVKQVAKQYPGLTLAGTGGRMDHATGSRRSDLMFQYSGKLDRQVGTRLIRSILEDYVERVNSSRALRGYLREHEFQRKHVLLSVLHWSPTGRDVVHPEISAVDYARGQIIFCTWRADGRGYEMEEEHDYEEALMRFGS